MNILNSNQFKSVLKYVIVVSIVIPVCYVVYEVVFLGKESVVISVELTVYTALIILYYGLLLMLGIVWGVGEIKQILRLRNEKVKNELKYLKAQVSPHFFFNMLNNLYGSIDTDATKAKKIVLELSDLMRYSIYQGEKEHVTLKEEISFIQNYISLQKVRYYKDLQIDFKIDVEDENIQLMPLIFINLVENAFKHGVENLRDKAYVYIKLLSKESMIYFEVENNFDKEYEEKEEEGVGLPNLTKRLDLVYPNAHKLTSTIVDNVFNIQLTLYKL